MFTMGPPLRGAEAAAGCVIDPYYTPSGAVGTIFSAHFEGANGSVIVDSSTFAWTLSDNGASPRVSTADHKFGAGCGSFNTLGGANTASSASIVLDANFTIEMWAKFSSGGAGSFFLFRQAAFDITTDISISYGIFSNKVSAKAFNGANLQSSVISTGAWYHIGLVRSGSTISLYLNGVFQASSTSSSSTGASYIQLGESVNVKLDEVRVTRGAARNMLDAFNATTPNCDHA